MDPFDRLSIKGLTGFAPGAQLTLVGKRPDGSNYEVPLNHTFNENQIKVGRQARRGGSWLAGLPTTSMQRHVVGGPLPLIPCGASPPPHHRSGSSTALP